MRGDCHHSLGETGTPFAAYCSCQIANWGAWPAAPSRTASVTTTRNRPILSHSQPCDPVKHTGQNGGKWSASLGGIVGHGLVGPADDGDEHVDQHEPNGSRGTSAPSANLRLVGTHRHTNWCCSTCTMCTHRKYVYVYVQTRCLDPPGSKHRGCLRARGGGTTTFLIFGGS